LVLTSGTAIGLLPAETAPSSTSFTTFEGTSEIQLMIIGGAVTGLDVQRPGLVRPGRGAGPDKRDARDEVGERRRSWLGALVACPVNAA
jgi:hypothetical protein